MKNQNKKVSQFFQILGLDQAESTLYLNLVQKGILTTLELSRNTGISRTQVYRLLDKMKNKGVIEEVIDEKRVMAKAVEIDELTKLIKDKERQLNQLHELFPQAKQFLLGHMGQNQPDTKVLFYRGRRGLQQMVWHTLRAHKETLGYTYRRIEEMVGEKFMLDWRKAFIEKKLILRDIYSESYFDSLAQAKKKLSCPTRIFQSRYIPPETFDISMHMDIYNDVVAYANWYEGEVFGVEIYNRLVARFHKQMFEFIWDRGVEEKNLSKAKKTLLNFKSK